MVLALATPTAFGQEMLVVRGNTTDEQRVADVHAIARVVERFHDKAGHYPCEEAYQNPTPGYRPVPCSVVITSQDLPEQWKYPPPGRSGRVIPLPEFRAYLEGVLGPIELPEDDWPVSIWEPRFYQYMFDGKAYYVSAVLLAATERTRELGPTRHKYQVSSISAPKHKILRFKEIDESVETPEVPK
jgi:hypothetical protein